MYNLGLNGSPVDSSFYVISKYTLDDMKSKKRARPVANVADWQEKWVDVLALRDNTLKTDPAGENFARTVVKYLSKAYGVEYTLSQATRKLDYIWDKHGRDGPKRPNLIYQEGSACLENLDLEVHKKIEKRSKAIEHEQFIENLSQRTTRSASRCGSKSLLTFDIEASPSPRKKARPALLRQSPCPKDKKLYKEHLQVSLIYGRGTLYNRANVGTRTLLRMSWYCCQTKKIATHHQILLRRSLLFETVLRKPVQMATAN